MGQMESLICSTRWRFRVGYAFVTYVCSSQLFLLRWEITTNLSVNADNDRQVRLVEWVDKASFTRLNKLFEISASKRNHQVHLSDKNLLVRTKDPKPFIIPIFPRVAFSSLVPDEHFVLKDLPFYVVARLADSEARHAHLEQWEKKCQEGTLRQAPIINHLISSSTVRPPAKKKKGPVVQPIKRARTPPPASPSSSLASSSSPSSSLQRPTRNWRQGLSEWCLPLLVKRKKRKTWLQIWGLDLRRGNTRLVRIHRG